MYAEIFSVCIFHSQAIDPDFRVQIFTDDRLSTKTVKITYRENFRVYGATKRNTVHSNLFQISISQCNSHRESFIE